MNTDLVNSWAKYSALLWLTGTMWPLVILCRSPASVRMGQALLSPSSKWRSTVRYLWATKQCTESALACACGSWLFLFLWLTSRTAETLVLLYTMGKTCNNASNTNNLKFTYTPLWHVERQNSGVYKKRWCHLCNILLQHMTFILHLSFSMSIEVILRKVKHQQSFEIKLSHR